MQTAKELFEQAKEDILNGKTIFPAILPEEKKTEELHDVPLRYREAKLSDFPDKLNSDQSVYFWSAEPGTGKTHLAWAFYVQERLKSSKSKPLFSTFGALQLRLRASMDKSTESEQEIINEFSNRKLVILDDLGGMRVKGASDYSVDMIYEIIDARYSWKRQTIITSNKSVSEISQSFDDRIASRIIGMCEIIELSGEDRRLKNGK